METPRRRDLLTTAAYAGAGIGGVLALWPFIAALNPAADTIAKRITFDTKPLGGPTRAVTIEVREEPVLIIRRTAEELVALRDTRLPNKTRDPYSPLGNAFRDRDSEFSIQPTWARNWHRSLRPDIMVCSARCTRDGCVIWRPAATDVDMHCPCCGSHFDFAGRALSGPAPTNLPVPPYRYIDATTIEFIEGEAPA